MKLQPAVKQETGKIAIGVGILSALMLCVYLVLGRFGLPVLLGTLLGALFAVFNFFLMAVGVQRAAESMNGVQVAPEPEEGEEEPPLSPQAKKAKQRMQLSYFGRLLLLGGMAAAAYYIPGIDPVPALLAQFFPRITIMIEGFLMKKEAQTP